MSVLKPVDYYIDKMKDVISIYDDKVIEHYRNIQKNNYTFDDNLNVNCTNMDEKCYCCINCNDCFNCFMSIDSNNCRECNRCERCNDCVNCFDCIACNKCSMCSNCESCEDCEDCESSNNCLRCKTECWCISFCTDCEHCSDCECCNQCSFSIRCRTIDECPADEDYNFSLNYCYNCFDCTNCYKCANCVKCNNVEHSYNCISCDNLDKCIDCSLSSNQNGYSELNNDNGMSYTHSYYFHPLKKYKVINDLKLILSYVKWKEHTSKNTSGFITLISNLYKRTFENVDTYDISDDELIKNVKCKDKLNNINNFEDLDKLLTMIEELYSIDKENKLIKDFVDDFKYLEIEPALKELNMFCPDLFTDDEKSNYAK